MLGFGGKPPTDKPKSKVGFLKFYDNLLFAAKAQNDSKAGQHPMIQSDEFSMDFRGSYCNNKISYYYWIDSFPRYLNLDFKEQLRILCAGDTRLTFLNYLRPHKIEWDSPHMRSKLRIMSQIGDEKKSTNVTAYNLHENLGGMQSQEWIESSLTYLSEADISRGRGLLKSSILMCIEGEIGVDFDKSVKAVTDSARRMGIKLTRVLCNVPDTMRAFSPFVHDFVTGISDTMPSKVLTDEIVARFSTYSQGILGAGGTYFGTDIYSGFPVFKRVKQGAEDAENWLITAETGGGKSFAVKFIVLELLAQGFNGTIMDIEGREYSFIGEFFGQSCNVQVVNMAEGSGKYFDPVEIAPPSGVPEIDADAKTMSMNFTLATFKVLLGVSYQRDEWLDTIIDDAVGLTYTRAGITDDPNTWRKSQNLSMFDVYKTLKTLVGYRKNVEYDNSVIKALAIMSRYFTEGGTRANMFRNRVRISDVAAADLVICSFGMEGKAESSVDPIQLALMQLGAAQFSHQRSIFSKARGKFNFKLWEEFQRWGKFPGSEKTIGVAVTGGRKLGDVNIIVTNFVKDILNDDRFGILSNITSFMVGAIADSGTRKAVCTALSVPQMIPSLDKIAEAAAKKDEIIEEAKAAKTNKEDGDEQEIMITADNMYSHAFLTGLDRNKFGIVKIILPPEIAKSNLFFTGVTRTPEKKATRKRVVRK